MINNTTNSRPLALVTGAARRIGEAITNRLHSEGYDIAIHCRHSIEKAAELAETLNAKRGNSVKVFTADLDQLNEIEQLADEVTHYHGRCDLLVNNASTFFPTDIQNSSEQDWDKLFNSNAKAPFFLAQAFSGVLKKNHGCIINIADIHAYRPLKNHTLYCMAKAANVMLTKSLALEMAPDVRVNGVAPGAALWPEDENGNAKESPHLLQKIPLQRLGGADAIADAVWYLSQPESYITGQILNVDGGKSLLQ